MKTRINLEQLKTFLVVVRSGGVHKASKVLHLTQPAITTRIKNLESSLSTKLFDRASSKMQLTKRGEMLVNYAEKFAQLAEFVERDIIEPHGIDGRLRLGVSETIAQSWLPEYITEMRQKYPKLEIDINVDISSNLREALLERKVDLAILLGPISEYTVDNIELPVFELVWYMSSDMSFSDNIFRDNPVVAYARNTRPYRELKSELFNRIGPNVSLFPSSSLSACLRLVETGLGVAALPKILGDDLVKNDLIKEFDPGWRPSPLNFTASYLSDSPSHLVETAANIAKNVSLAFFSDK